MSNAATAKKSAKLALKVLKGGKVKEAPFAVEVLTYVEIEAKAYKLKGGKLWRMEVPASEQTPGFEVFGGTATEMKAETVAMLRALGFSGRLTIEYQ